jgi:membrane protease YdiL (CAAX protease family)
MAHRTQTVGSQFGAWSGPRVRVDAMSDDTRPRSAPWSLLPALGVAISAVLLFGLELRLAGYLLLAVGVLLAFVAGRELGKDLLLIGIGLSIVGAVSVEANIDWWNIVLLGSVLIASVAVPFVLDRFVYRHRTIRFPVPRTKWTLLERSWLVGAVIAAYLILPVYFIRSGVYQNWPAIHEWHEVMRLFFGVNAVGIWDELFFICVVFSLLRRHFPDWQAILLQAVIFVSFLWELGYRSWGPAITIPFAIMQAFIFTRTKSLPYVICVHLLFDFLVFLSIVHAHNRDWLRIFIY